MRRRGAIALNRFPFHRQNVGHDRFEVTITDAHGPFVYQVRGWGNLIRTLDAFTSTVAHEGVQLVARAEVYRTGETTVNSYNVVVTPLVEEVSTRD